MSVVVVVVVVDVDVVVVDDLIVVLAFLMPILPLLTTAPELVLTIPKCRLAAFCRAHLTIRCIGSGLVLGSGEPPAATPAADHKTFFPESPSESILPP